MTLTVAPEVEGRIQAMMDSGAYTTVDQLLTAALERLAVDEVVESIGVAELQKIIDEGVRSAKEEPLVSPEEARAYLAKVRADWVSRG